MCNENLLIEMAKNGSEEAKMEIVNNYDNMVHSFIRKYYSSRTMNSDLYDDLHSEGVMAVLNAINTYDETKAKFSTHCYLQVRASIQNGLKQQKKDNMNGLYSLDRELNDDGENAITLLDVVPNGERGIDEDYENNDERNRVWTAIKKVCTKAEYETLVELAKDNNSYENIANTLNTTVSAICRRRNRSFKKIQKELGIKVK